jgi:hypothetical protein
LTQPCGRVWPNSGWLLQIGWRGGTATVVVVATAGVLGAVIVTTCGTVVVVDGVAGCAGAAGDGLIEVVWAVFASGGGGAWGVVSVVAGGVTTGAAGTAGTGAGAGDVVVCSVAAGALGAGGRAGSVGCGSCSAGGTGISTTVTSGGSNSMPVEFGSGTTGGFWPNGVWNTTLLVGEALDAGIDARNPTANRMAKAKRLILARPISRPPEGIEDSRQRNKRKASKHEPACDGSAPFDDPGQDRQESEKGEEA